MAATLTTRTPGEWRPGVTNGPDYCVAGEHFIGSGERVWRFWTSPITSLNCVCAECAGETEGESDGT